MARFGVLSACKTTHSTGLSDQPILKTADVPPAIDGFVVLGAFNPATCLVNGEVIMLLRVAEAPQPKPHVIQIPLLEDRDGVPTLTVREFAEPDGGYDPRVITVDGKQCLTSLSHLRLARSRDGITLPSTKRRSFFRPGWTKPTALKTPALRF